MIIRNAKVFIDGKFHDVDVRFDEKCITEIGKNLSGDQIIDAEGNELYAGMTRTAMADSCAASAMKAVRKHQEPAMSRLSSSAANCLKPESPRYSRH